MLIEGILGGKILGDKEPTQIMGVINLSPGSFFKGSVKTSKFEIGSQITAMMEAGADFLDVGAISSAPAFLYQGSDVVSESTERERLSKFFDAFNDIGEEIPLSIDTQSAKTAEYALSKGATIINDISGFKSDQRLPIVIADHQASAIIMSCREKPGDVYIVSEILDELQNSLIIGQNAGIPDSKMVVDPGLGGWIPEREIEADYNILKNLPKLRSLGRPILLGISRKSFIGKVLNEPPDGRLFGSLAATAIGVSLGAHIIRTHDVKETRDACKIAFLLKQYGL
ncbi:MAG: dihydropteroate synthase [Candidatus Heimdallarchaeota archaeon]